MSEYLVSVIIPTYKRPFSRISIAINSVLNQTIKNIEVIIVDDSPDDYSERQKIEKQIKNIKDDRIKYVAHNVNRGACAARNTGIEHSSGRYIGFLDDDDEWLADKLELQLSKFTNEEVGLVYCAAYTIIEKDNKEIESKVRSYTESGYVFDKLIKRNFIGSTSFVLIKSEVIKKCGLFNLNMNSAQDYEYWLRIAQHYKVDFVDKPLVKYYIHEGERISTNINSRIQGLENLNEINISYLKRHSKTYSIRKAKIIPYYFERDGYLKALVKFFETIKIYPFNKLTIKYMVKITLKQMKLKS